MQIRELRDEDTPGVVALLREVRPAGLWSVDAIRHWIGTLPERAQLARWVADDDGTIVGWADGLLSIHSDIHDSGGLHTSVLPRWRRRGVGRALHDLAFAHLRSLGTRRIAAVAVDDDGFGFLERRGYRHTHTERFSRVDLSTADLSEREPLSERLRAEGFTVVPFADCRPEDVHAVDLEASADIPEDEPITVQPLEEWLARHWRHPQLTKEGSFAILHEGRVVTIAMLRLDREGRRAGNDLTGTLRAYRGRGLARLAKLSQLEWAAANGIESVMTSNDETNAAMLAVNTRLGYRPFTETKTYVWEAP